MKKFNVPRDTLEQLYNTPYSLYEISRITGSSVTAIRYRMIKWDIKRRTYPEAAVISLARPDVRAKLGRRPKRFSQHSLQKILSVIRQSIFPLMQYQRQNSKCSMCDKPATVMHHDPSLAKTLDDLLRTNLSPLEATIQIVKDHYNDVIKPTPRCKDHHNH